jgi:hypothetical protein
MKGAFLTLLGTIALIAGVAAAAAWSPWDGDTREREQAWLGSLHDWALDPIRPLPCERDLEEAVGSPPSARLDPVYEAARAGCQSDDHWESVQWDVEGSLLDSHRRDAVTSTEYEFGRIAERIAGRSATVYCWLAGDWDPLAEQYAALGRREFTLVGLAHPYAGRIDLSSAVCDRLHAFFDGVVPELGTPDAYELAQALATLAHEAEHLRQPRAAEAEVQCYALQRVRDLVRERGQGPGYQEELALLAWDVGYPLELAEYRTTRCRDGGPFDLRPDSSVWP